MGDITIRPITFQKYSNIVHYGGAPVIGYLSSKDIIGQYTNIDSDIAALQACNVDGVS